MSAMLPWIVLALGVALGLVGARYLPRLRKPKPPQGLPFLTKDEIMDTDAKLRMLIGEEPEPRPKRPRMTRASPLGSDYGRGSS
jgi:hypothetical protein